MRNVQEVGHTLDYSFGNLSALLGNYEHSQDGQHKSHTLTGCIISIDKQKEGPVLVHVNHQDGQSCTPMHVYLPGDLFRGRKLAIEECVTFTLSIRSNGIPEVKLAPTEEHIAEENPEEIESSSVNGLIESTRGDVALRLDEQAYRIQH